MLTSVKFKVLCRGVKLSVGGSKAISCCTDTLPNASYHADFVLALVPSLKCCPYRSSNSIFFVAIWSLFNGHEKCHPLSQSALPLWDRCSQFASFLILPSRLTQCCDLGTSPAALRSDPNLSMTISHCKCQQQDCLRGRLSSRS